MAQVVSQPSGKTRQPSTYLSNTYPENSDPTRLQLAYGRRAIPKLVAEAQAEDLLTRQQALISLAELFHNPEFISQGLHVDIVAILTRYSNDFLFILENSMKVTC